MPVTVKVAPFPLDPSILSDEGLMREVGDLAVRLIRTRTEKGLDVENTPFLPLSAAYAERRQKAGYGSTSNLTLSGQMLNDMAVVSVSGNKVTLGFRSEGNRPGRGGTLVQRSRETGAQNKAFWHHVSGAGQSRVKRRFFDLSAQDVQQITAAVRSYLDRSIRAAISGAAGLSAAAKATGRVSIATRMGVGGRGRWRA
jgi:phage gpG-like protein